MARVQQNKAFSTLYIYEREVAVNEVNSNKGKNRRVRGGEGLRFT